MASIQNLEVLVEVDISQAISALTKLQDELRDVADSIKMVDTQGAEGIDIRTSLDDLDSELAAVKAEMEAFEATNELNIDTDVDNLEALFAAQSRSPKDIMGRMGGNRTGFGSTPFNINLPRSRFSMTGQTIGVKRQPMSRLGSMRHTLDKLTPNLKEFDLRMSDMHNTLARFIPLLLVFVGVIPAAITALVGLAAAAVAAGAALLAIAGFGAMGVALEDGQFKLDNLKDVLKDIRDSLVEAFAPLAERLQPVFEDAVDGLDKVFQAIAKQGDALMALVDDAKAFGGFMLEYIPGVLRSMAGTVEAFRPIFEDIAGFFREATVLRTLTELTLEAYPAMAKMMGIIIDAIPWIVKMSVGFAKVAKWVMFAMKGFAAFLDVIGIGPKMFGMLSAAALTLTTTLALLNSTIVGSLIGSFAKLGAMVVGHIGRLLGLSAANVIATISTWGLYTALMALIGLVTLGAGLALGGAILGLASDFDILGDDVDRATESLKDFDRVANGTGDDFNPYGGPDGAPRSGAGKAGKKVGGGGGTTINIESSGDNQQDKDNARYGAWRQGRTTGGGM